jgi:putative lipoic acid-binding regulatory protein
VNCLALAFVFDLEQAQYIAMDGFEEGDVDEQEGQAITAIREALSGTVIRVLQNIDPRLFSDIDSFVKLSKGNKSITTVEFNIFEIEGNDALWENIGEGLANLESLMYFHVNFDYTHETAPRADCRTLAIVLPYLRQEFAFYAFSEEVDPPFSRDEVKAFTRVIRRHTTIKEFYSVCNFHANTLSILLSAMATAISRGG